MSTTPPLFNRVKMAQPHELPSAAAAAANLPRPWEDTTLPPEGRRSSYLEVVKAKCRAIIAVSQREGITLEERKALKDHPETQFWARELTCVTNETAEQFCARLDLSPALRLAQKILDSYSFNRTTRVSTYSLPAGVTDVEVMKALNEYFRRHHTDLSRNAIFEEDVTFLATFPSEFPKHCEERDYSRARDITIIGVVKGTKGKTRSRQEKILKDHSLVFADPRDQAIVTAIHACRCGGEDLLRGKHVRGSVPGLILETVEKRGVLFETFSDNNNSNVVAASGAPIAEVSSKK